MKSFLSNDGFEIFCGDEIYVPHSVEGLGSTLHTVGDFDHKRVYYKEVSSNGHIGVKKSVCFKIKANADNYNKNY